MQIAYYLILLGISIQTFVGNWTSLQGNRTIRCLLPSNQPSTLNCLDSKKVLQTFLLNGESITLDRNPKLRGVYNLNASISWSNGENWVKGINFKISFNSM